MTIKEFSTCFNSVTYYTLRVVSIDKNKIEIFINELTLDIIKDVLMGDNPPQSYLEALSKALRSEAMRLRMT